MRKIPFFHQRTEYYCGPAIIQMVLAIYGIRVTQRKIAWHAKTDKMFGKATGKETGTSIHNMLRTLRIFGVIVQAGNNRTTTGIKRALKQNKLVIVCFTEREYSWGHYAFVLGFKGSYIKLLDPAEHMGRGKSMTTSEFKHR